jgi:hypothetical protein
MSGDPLHPAASHIPLVDGIAREVARDGIRDELHLHLVVL